MTVIPETMRGISLFSGAGGMDVGFARAGVNIFLANEIDKDACATYEANHDGKLLKGSLLDFDFRKYRGEADIVFGGPPCQGFSVAGKMNPNDERSQLIHAFFDVVDKVRPSIFVCENVKALATLERWSGVRSILLERSSRNYVAKLVVLNATQFGVPQIRERMFIIGFRKDVFPLSEEALHWELNTRFQALKKRPQTVSSIVRRLGRAGTGSNTTVCNAKITFARSPIMRSSPYAGMLFNGAGRPLPSNGWATTLPASMGGNKTPIVDEDEIFDGKASFVEKYHAHLQRGGAIYKGEAPSRLRRLTVEECLAIQTFPSDYELRGSRSAMYRQIGNAVPCNLAEAVATAAMDVLRTFSNRVDGIGTGRRAR